MTVDTWDFTFPKQEEHRRANLERDSPFQDIAEEITTTMTVLCCHKGKCEEGPHAKGTDGRDVPLCHRPIYCLSVS